MLAVGSISSLLLSVLALPSVGMQQGQLAPLPMPPPRTHFADPAIDNEFGLKYAKVVDAANKIARVDVTTYDLFNKEYEGKPVSKSQLEAAFAKSQAAHKERRAALQDERGLLTSLDGRVASADLPKVKSEILFVDEQLSNDCRSVEALRAALSRAALLKPADK